MNAVQRCLAHKGKQGPQLPRYKLDPDIALPFPVVSHIPSVSSGRRSFMSPPGLQNCQSGLQHQSWKALATREALQLPGLITHIFLTYLPSGAAEDWFLGVRAVLER